VHLEETLRPDWGHSLGKLIVAAGEYAACEAFAGAFELPAARLPIADKNFGSMP
jgi:hypothetical protein